MEQNERYTDKLAKYVLIAAAVCLAGAVCWYFRSVITYILVAVVVSLIGKPVVKLLQKINIKGKRLPDWFLAALTLTVIVGALMSVITLLIPIVSNIVKGISLSNIESAAGQIAVPLANLNETLRNTFPSLGSGFRIETALLAELQKLLDVSKVSSLIGTATSFLSSFGVAMFSIVFIGLFFIKDDDTFTNIVTALVPD